MLNSALQKISGGWNPFYLAISATALTTAMAVTAFIPAAWAQTAPNVGFPNKPIRLVSGASAGSASDVVARSISNALQNDLGVSVVVENRTGAGGLVAARHILASPADGYSVFVYTSAHTLNPLITQVGYDPAADFSGVTPLAHLPNVLVAAPSKGFKTVQDLIQAGKAKPGQLNYASAGIGTATFMNAEKFNYGAGIKAVHVAFKGTPEALTETSSGRIDYFFAPIVSVLPMIRDGRLVALAVGTTKRTPVLPDTPTTLEVGVPESDYIFWTGMLVPSKTPRDVVQALNQAALRALQNPEVKERLAKLGAEPMPMSPTEFDNYIKGELAANAKIVKAANIKAD